ncbi:hypothetical protein DYB32_005043 [Aphanomyces invadans]|uniref:Uncharacterized protein n=1 Tax=Aphanomyces invadans TaxID=157072 RepID=A0A418AVP4_9STRA|nr:hypothetical protein DYB32_005043 [Aphanomyces invadans]
MSSEWRVFEMRMLSSLVFAFQDGKSYFLRGIEQWYPMFAIHCKEKRGPLRHGHVHLDDLADVMDHRRDHIAAWIERNRANSLHIHEVIQKHPPFGHVLEQHAAYVGDVALLQLLYNMHVPNGFPLVNTLIHVSACHGHVNILRFLSIVGYTNHVLAEFVSPMEIASRGGHLAFIQILHTGYGRPSIDSDQPKKKKPRSVQQDHQIPLANFSERALAFAAKQGHVDVVKYICTVGGITTSPDALDLAAMGGHSPVVKFLTEPLPSMPATTLAMDHAASQGNLDLVEFLHAHRTEGCTPAAMDAAASHGHIDVVKFLHSNRHEGCTKDAVDHAAANGFADIVQFLVLHRPEGGTSETLKVYASRGDVRMVKWLHEHWKHSKWPVQAVNAAATNGHATVVQYLMDRQLVAYSPHALVGAAKNGHFDVVDYLLPKKPPKTCVARAIESALASHHDKIAKYLKDHVCACCAKKIFDVATTKTGATRQNMPRKRR